MMNSAQEHFNVCDALNMQVVDVLKNLERKNEEQRKRVSRNLDVSLHASFPG